MVFLTFLNEGDPRQLIKRVKFKGTTGVSDLTADAVRIFQGIALLGPCEVTSPGTDFCMDPRLFKFASATQYVARVFRSLL